MSKRVLFSIEVEEETIECPNGNIPCEHEAFKNADGKVFVAYDKVIDSYLILVINKGINDQNRYATYSVTYLPNNAKIVNDNVELEEDVLYDDMICNFDILRNKIDNRQ